jgi:hypothetical protein
MNAKERLAKLIDLKSIVTILLTGALIYGWLEGKVSSEQFVPFCTMIYMFYFTKKKEGE